MLAFFFLIKNSDLFLFEFNYQENIFEVNYNDKKAVDWNSGRLSSCELRGTKYCPKWSKLSQGGSHNVAKWHTLFWSPQG